MSLGKPKYKKRAYKKRNYKKSVFKGINRSIAMSHQCKYFTETFQAPSITVPAAGLGGQFTATFADLTNYVNYQAIFNQMTILSFTVKLVPDTGAYNYGSSPPTTILNWRVNREGQMGVPVGSLQMLQNDRNRTLQLDGTRIIKLTCKDPKPYLTQVDNVGTAVAVQQPLKQWVWLNSINGQNTKYHGIDFFIQNPGSGTQPLIYSVYITATVACKNQT